MTDVLDRPVTLRREVHAATAVVWDDHQKMLRPFRTAGVVAPDFEFKPGFIYAQVRAITARINQNFDGWPSAELKKSYRSFIGKPIFVNHQNFDPKLARGKVVAARYYENGDDKGIETVMEVDAHRFPKLAHEIKTGGMDSVSMGVEAGFTICSVCNNKAVDTPDFCDHVKFHKGQVIRTASGEETLVYEKCYKLGFFELSYVFDPADETAVVSRVIAASNQSEARMDIRDIEAAIDRMAAPATWGAQPAAPTGGTPYTVQPGDNLWDIQKSHGLDPSGTQDLAQSNGIANPNMIQPGQQINLPTAPAPKPPAPAAPTGFKPPTGGVGQSIQPPGGADAGGWFKSQQPAGGPKPSDMGHGELSNRGGVKPQDYGTGQLTTMKPQAPKNPAAPSTGQAPKPASPTLPKFDMIPDANPMTPKPSSGSTPAAPAGLNGGSGGAAGSSGATKPSTPSGGSSLPKTPKTPGILSALESRINRLAYGEIEAPEDVDTLRNDGKDENPFQNMMESPEELRGPDLDKTKRLDRAQEDQGLDADRNVESIEDIGGPSADGDQSEDEDLINEVESDLDRLKNDIGGSQRGARRTRPRNHKEARAMARNRYSAADVLVDPRTGRRYYAADDPSMDPSMGGGDPSAGGPPQSDEDLIAEAESDLEKADQAAQDDDNGTDDDDPTSNGGGSDDDYADQDDDSDDDDSDDSDDDSDSDSGGGDLPPWLQNGDSPAKEARRKGNRRSSTQKKRRKGAPMSLASRNRTASAQYPRRHYADDSGHTDGGPYHTNDNDQGEFEDVFLSQTPGSEAVAAPTPGDGTISNTENTLVARINQRSRALQRDINAYRVLMGEAVETPDQVNPALSGTNDQSVKSGDWDSIALDDVQTQPKDASLHAFAAFDRWLTQTTGRTARQHGNVTFIRRQAARFCQGTGINVESMFPALGNVLREARRNEGRRANMRRQADESLDVAAPQDRIDVEKPVSNTTDADAQASQFDLGDFGGNASDNLADPDLSADSQIWAPGEGDSSRTSNRKADGITAVRYAEAYIRAGLAPANEKFKIAGLAQTMRHGTIQDRIRLLDAINQQRAASARRTAGVNRGAGNSVPPGFGRALTAGQAHHAGNDLDSDVAIWLK